MHNVIKLIERRTTEFPTIIVACEGSSLIVFLQLFDWDDYEKNQTSSENIGLDVGSGGELWDSEYVNKPFEPRSK